MEHAPHLPVLTLDTIRRELHISPDDDQGTVVRVAKERARALLRARQPFVWNATNVTRSLRGRVINFIMDYGARVQIVYVAAPLDVLLRRNRERAAMVPDAVIRRLIDNLDVPDRTGRIVWNTYIRKLEDMPQTQAPPRRRLILGRFANSIIA